MKAFIITVIVTLLFGLAFLHDKNLELREKYQVLGKINNYTIYKLEPEFCATALEVIYEDDEHVYYFKCIKSENYFLKNNIKKISLKEALQTKVIHIHDLIKLEPNIIIEPKDSWYKSHIPAGKYIILYSKT